MWMGGPHKFKVFNCLEKNDIEDTHGVASSNWQVGQTTQVRGGKMRSLVLLRGGRITECIHGLHAERFTPRSVT